MKKMTFLLSVMMFFMAQVYAQKESKTLVAYFSATGNTRTAAKEIAKLTETKT